MSKTMSVGKTPVIEIEIIGGDLSVVGWEGDDILLKADDDELQVEQQGERVEYPAMMIFHCACRKPLPLL